MFEILSILQIICVITSFMITFSILDYESNSNEHKLLLIGMVYVFIYNMGCVFELNCKGKEAALFIFQIKSIAVCHIMILMFLFIIEYYNLKWSKPFRLFLIALNILIVAGILTCNSSQVFFNKIDFVVTKSYSYLDFENGIGAYGYYIMICFLGLIINFETFKKYLENLKDKKRKRELYLFMSSIIPFLSFFCYHFFLKPYNPMPAALVISGVFLAAGTYKYQLFDVVESVKDRMIDTMKDAIIIVDSQGGFLHANKTAKRIFEDLKRKKKGEKLLKRIDFDNIIESYPQEFIHNNCYYECSTTIVWNNDEIEGYAFYITDITKRREYMENLIRMKEKADEANNAKSTFLANMSHDLRTPMNAIIGMCQIVMRKEQDKKIKEMIESIQWFAQDLLGLINNILDISKIEAGKLELKKETYNIIELLYETAAMTYILLMNKPIDFYVKISTRVPKFMIGDSIKVREIIMNLLGNAVKFTKSGEIILDILWDETLDKGNLVIRVSDTGIGMKKENLDIIFEEYEQIGEESEKARGTGLGLPIVKKLAKLMDGSVQVESTYGEGSIFTVMICQEKTDEDEWIESRNYTKQTIDQLRNGEKEQKEQLKFPGKRILVVDDISINLKVMKGLLEPYNLVVETASNGKMASELMKNRLFDMVLMDSRMPDMNGEEVAELIRNEKESYFKDLPIIMVSAEGNYGEAKKYGKYGFTSNLVKPVQTKEIEQIMIQYLSEAMLDMRAGIKQTGGKKEQYMKILKTYNEEIGELKNELPSIWQTNKELFNVKVHGIKGSSWNIGAIYVGNQAELIEKRSKKGDKEFVKNNLNFFIQSLEQLLERISQVIEQEKEMNVADKVTDEDRKEEKFYQLMEQFHEAFSNYDIEKLELLMNELDGWEKEEKIKPFILNIKRLINELEYERGESYVAQWIEKNKKNSKNC